MPLAGAGCVRTIGSGSRWFSDVFYSPEAAQQGVGADERRHGTAEGAVRSSTPVLCGPIATLQATRAVVKPLRIRRTKATLRLREIPLSVVATTVAVVSALATVPFIAAHSRNATSVVAAQDVRGLLKVGMTPAEVLAAIRGRAMVVHGDDGCWADDPATACSVITLRPLEGRRRRSLGDNLLVLRFGLDAKLLQVDERRPAESDPRGRTTRP